MQLKMLSAITSSGHSSDFNRHPFLVLGEAAEPGSREGLRKSAQPLTSTLSSDSRAPPPAVMAKTKPLGVF